MDEKNRKRTIFLSILLLILISISLFTYTVHIRKPWFGVIGKENSQELAGEVLLFAKNWYSEGPFKLWYGMFHQPKSIEFPELTDRLFYSSDMPGSVLPIYLIAKLKGHPPSIPMIMKYNLLNHYLVTIILVLTIFFFLLKVLQFKEISSFVFSLIPIFTILLTPAPLYYFQNVYFSVLAGILPFVVTIFLELLRYIYKDKKHCRFIDIAQKFAIFWGMITIIDFVFIALVLYIVRIIAGEIRLRNQFIRKSFIFWLPILIPIFLYLLQLLKFGDWNAIWNKIVLRTAITDEGARFTKDLFRLFWFKYFKDGFGLMSVFLFLGSIFIYVLTVIYTIFLKIKKKVVDTKISVMLSLIGLYLIPPFLTFFIFKNVIAIHRYFIVMLCPAAAVIPLILTPILIMQVFSIEIEKSRITLQLSSKFRKKTVNMSLSLILALFFFGINLLIIFNYYPGYKNFFYKPNLVNIKAAQFIERNTEFKDTVLSPHIDISNSNFNLLAYSMKNVYRFNSLFEVYRTYSLIEGSEIDSFFNIFIIQEHDTTIFQDIEEILSKARIIEDKAGDFKLYKLSKCQFVKLKPEIEGMMIERVKTAINRKDLIILTEAKDIIPIISDSSFSEYFEREYRKLVNEHKMVNVCSAASFLDYKIIKSAHEKYLIKLLFKVNAAFKKDWNVYFHGWVDQKDIRYLSKERQKYGFENWDFYPNPATTKWLSESYIVISKEIEAKPIAYQLELGFYRIGEGRKGNRIYLGEINLIE